MQRSLLILLLLLSLPFMGLSQSKASLLLREGNKAMEQKEYTRAERAFRNAFAQDSTISAVRYGLGNALYEQGKYKEALQVYGALDTKKITKQEEAAQLFHNIGDAQLKTQQFAQAAESFKQSLRFNPTDDETRYNLALALKQIPKDNQQNQQNQQQQEPNPKSNEPKEQEKKQENSDKQPEKNSIDPQTAKKILDSYQQDEEQTRRRYEQRQRQMQPEKDRNKKRW